MNGQNRAMQGTNDKGADDKGADDTGLTRRGFLGVASALGLGGLLAGCGGGGGSSTTSAGGAYQPDLSRFTPNYGANITLYHWPALPVRVYFANDLTVTPQGGSPTRVNDLILTGFGRWPAATGGVVGFTQVTDPNQAQITVSTVTIPDPTGLSETGKTSVTPGAGNVLQSATTQIYVWPDITVPELTQGLLATSAHEFGHALGIGGHSLDPGDVMYVSHYPNADVPLSARDLNTIKTIYYFLFPNS